MSRPNDLVLGTLDLLLLKILALEPLHGWAIGLRLRSLSGDVLQVPQGSLYPALYRLEHKGWIAAKAGATDSGRQVKFYRLTSAGRAHLKFHISNLKFQVSVLRSPPSGPPSPTAPTAPARGSDNYG